MGLRIRKSKQVGPARVTAGPHGASASVGKRARFRVSKRGAGLSFRILPGITWRIK